jgi:hypothetical protein
VPLVDHSSWPIGINEPLDKHSLGCGHDATDNRSMTMLQARIDHIDVTACGTYALM